MIKTNRKVFLPLSLFLVRSILLHHFSLRNDAFADCTEHKELVEECTHGKFCKNKAFDNDKNQEWLDELVEEVVEEFLKVEVPTNVVVSAESVSKLGVKWKSPASVSADGSEVNSYKIEWDTSLLFDSDEGGVLGSRHIRRANCSHKWRVDENLPCSYRITDLEEGTPYYVRIFAYSSKYGYSKFAGVPDPLFSIPETAKSNDNENEEGDKNSIYTEKTLSPKMKKRQKKKQKQKQNSKDPEAQGRDNEKPAVFPKGVVLLLVSVSAILWIVIARPTRSFWMWLVFVSCAICRDLVWSFIVKLRDFVNTIRSSPMSRSSALFRFQSLVIAIATIAATTIIATALVLFWVVIRKVVSIMVRSQLTALISVLAIFGIVIFRYSKRDNRVWFENLVRGCFVILREFIDTAADDEPRPAPPLLEGLLSDFMSTMIQSFDRNGYDHLVQLILDRGRGFVTFFDFLRAAKLGLRTSSDYYDFVRMGFTNADAYYECQRLRFDKDTYDRRNTCRSCYEENMEERDKFGPTCGHNMCLECTVNYIRAGLGNVVAQLTDNGLLCVNHPNGCDQCLSVHLCDTVRERCLELPLPDGLVPLTEAETMNLNRFIVERTLGNYLIDCPSPTCSARFMSEVNVGDVGRCPTCGVRICMQCRSLHHGGITCQQAEQQGQENDLRNAPDRIREEQRSQDYIELTTKPCPHCDVRTSHFHGHSCHHIRPGSTDTSGGCTNCHTHWCFSCGSTAAENTAQRGQRSRCRCRAAYWSTFCKSDGIQSNLVNKPYPHDRRCGCLICPECKPAKPCGSCDGDCVVCRSLVEPGPVMAETESKVTAGAIETTEVPARGNRNNNKCVIT